MVFTDLDGRIRSWNRGATAIFGYSAEEMIGQTPAALYPDGAADRLAPDLDRTLAGETFVGVAGPPPRRPPRLGRGQDHSGAQCRGQPAYASRFGLTPEQVVGKPVWEVVGETGYANFEHHMDEVLAGKRVEFEMEVPTTPSGRSP